MGGVAYRGVDDTGSRFCAEFDILSINPLKDEYQVPQKQSLCYFLLLRIPRLLVEKIGVGCRPGGLRGNMQGSMSRMRRHSGI